MSLSELRELNRPMNLSNHQLGNRFDSDNFLRPQETVGGATLSLAFGDLLNALETSVVSNLHQQGASFPTSKRP